MTRRLEYKHRLEEVLIGEWVTGWAMPWARGRGAVGTALPAPPRRSCHGSDQLPVTRMHALPCLKAHSPNALCSQGKISIPSSVRKGSTPLPGSPCNRQAINWVIFPALLEAVGKGRTKSAPSVSNLLQDELRSSASPQGLPCSHECQQTRVHQAP